MEFSSGHVVWPRLLLFMPSTVGSELKENNVFSSFISLVKVRTFLKQDLLNLESFSKQETIIISLLR